MDTTPTPPPSEPAPKNHAGDEPSGENRVASPAGPVDPRAPAGPPGPAVPPPYPSVPIAPPPPMQGWAAPRPRGFPWWKFLIAVFVLIVLCIGGCIAVLFHSKAVMEPAANQFLTHIHKKEYHAAFASIDPMWKSTTTEAKFTRLFKTISHLVGDFKSKSCIGFNCQIQSPNSYGVLTYSTVYSKDSPVVKISLIERQGIWKVAGVHYDSPKLDRMAQSAFLNSVDSSSSPSATAKK